MLNRIMDFVLDLLIVILLFLIAPLLFVLLTVPGPVYAKIVGVLFIALVTGAVVFCFRQKNPGKE